MWLLTKNSISRDLLWVGTHARGLWGGNGICGVACSQGPYHHWPPYNQPGTCCSQDLATPHQPAAISWSPYSHHVPWTRGVRPVPPPLLCSDGSTSVLQSFLLLWGPAQQLSQLCLKGASGTQGPGNLTCALSLFLKLMYYWQESVSSVHHSNSIFKYIMKWSPW